MYVSVRRHGCLFREMNAWDSCALHFMLTNIERAGLVYYSKNEYLYRYSYTIQYFWVLYLMSTGGVGF